MNLAILPPLSSLHKDKAVYLGHTIGPYVHTEVIRDMSHDLTWRVNFMLSQH